MCDSELVYVKASPAAAFRQPREPSLFHGDLRAFSAGQLFAALGCLPH
jgi:hypothetical protein